MEASQLFQSLTFNKLLQCTFLNTQENGMFYVSLVDPQANLNVAHVLINSRYAKPVAVTQDKKKINEIEITPKSQENVYMSDISNPGKGVFLDIAPIVYLSEVILLIVWLLTLPYQQYSVTSTCFSCKNQLSNSRLYL